MTFRKNNDLKDFYLLNVRVGLTFAKITFRKNFQSENKEAHFFASAHYVCKSSIFDPRASINTVNFITGGAGYKTLLLAVYKTSLFFGGSEVAVYKTSLLFRRPQVAVYKTLLFSESQNLQKVFFQIWLFMVVEKYCFLFEGMCPCKRYFSRFGWL